MVVVHRIRWWRLHSTTHLWTPRGLRSSSTEAQSLEQWGHWKSVVITAEAALRCLAAMSFWYRASLKLAAAQWTEPRHFGLSMAYPSRSLRLMWHHWRLALTVSLYHSFGLPWFLFAGLEFPIHQESRHSTLLHSNPVSNPSKLGLDDGGLYAGGLSLIEDLQIYIYSYAQMCIKVIDWQLNKRISISFNRNSSLTENKIKQKDSYYPSTAGQDITEKSFSPKSVQIDCYSTNVQRLIILSSSSIQTAT